MKIQKILIIAWLVNFMEPTMGKPFMILATVREVRMIVKETY